MVAACEGNEARGKGRRKSEHLIVPPKPGNSPQEDPVEMYR
jgi:hypothetical protein